MPAHVLHFETTGDDSIAVPFDNPEHSGAQFVIRLDPDAASEGDGIILAANPAGYRALAVLFAQLSAGGYPDGYHVHLGYSHEEPPGPGWRLVVRDAPESSTA